jgi:hypothetical protein
MSCFAVVLSVNVDEPLPSNVVVALPFVNTPFVLMVKLPAIVVELTPGLLIQPARQRQHLTT